MRLCVQIAGMSQSETAVVTVASIVAVPLGVPKDKEEELSAE